MQRYGPIVLAGAAAAAVVLGAGAVLAAGAGTPTPAAAATGPAAGTVSVDGVGQVSGTPDVLRVNLAVAETAASVSTAVEQANAAVRRVTAALGRAGVADRDVQTADVSIYQHYRPTGGPDGYQVSEGLTVLLRDLARAGTAISDAVAAGGDGVRLDGVSFDLQDNTALLARARAAAFADAQAKARQYAGLAGRSLGVVRSVTETDQPVSPRPYPMAASAGGALAAPSPVPLSPGSQQVTVDVSVVWALS